MWGYFERAAARGQCGGFAAGLNAPQPRLKITVE